MYMLINKCVSASQRPCGFAEPGCGGGKMAYDEKTAERVREVLSDRRDVVEKKLMGGLSFMVNGSMCCSVSGRGGLLVRVGAEAHAQMMADAHGRANHERLCSRCTGGLSDCRRPQEMGRARHCGGAPGEGQAAQAK